MSFAGLKYERCFCGKAGWMSLLVLLTAISAGTQAYGQVWSGSVSDLWGTAANWSPNTVPNSSTAAVTIGFTTNNPVLLNLNATVGTLTIGSNSSLSVDSGFGLTVDGGSIDNVGTIAIQSSGSLLSQPGLTTLSGAGTVTMSGGTLGAGSSSTLVTLANDDNLIEGYGNIGGAGLDPGGLTVINGGQILANVSGQTLSFSGGTGVVTFTNYGLAEATNGGTLVFSNLNNQGSGLVLAESGGTVETAANATITGGNTSQLLEAGSGGTLLLGQTGGSLNVSGELRVRANGGTVLLAGSETGGNAVFSAENGGTITANNTAEAWNSLTIDGGTLTANNSVLGISGSGGFLDNSGTIVLNSSELNFGPITLPVILDTGTITMNSGEIGVQVIGGLVNGSNTIQGTGKIVIASTSSFTNDGIVNANVSVGTLAITASGALSNSATMEATNGGTLAITGGLTNTGTVIVGGGSTLTASGAYTQTGGTTTVAGTLIAPTVSINGGLLEGTGTIGSASNQAFVLVGSGATIQPGDPPGTLDIMGALTLSAGSDFNELLGGSTAGTGYSILDVSGYLTFFDANLTLQDLNSFNPTANETFYIAYADNGLSGWAGDTFASNTIPFDGGTFTVGYLTSGCGTYQDCIDLTWQPSTAAEPGTAVLLGVVLVSLLLAGRRKLLADG